MTLPRFFYVMQDHPFDGTVYLTDIRDDELRLWVDVQDGFVTHSYVSGDRIGSLVIRRR